MPTPFDEQQQWRSVAMHDSAKRRGIWYATDSKSGDDFTSTPLTCILLCAGREGDDAMAYLEVGQVITEELLRRLEVILSTGAWMQETDGPDTNKQPFKAVRCRTLEEFKELVKAQAK